MLLYLIRHGESQYNAIDRVQGQSDVGLSPLGHRQRRALAVAFDGEPVDAAYASPLRRAAETARPLLERFGLPGQVDPRLKEIHAGVFQECSRAELSERFPEEYARWSTGDPDFVIPGGESRRQLMVRAAEAFEAIRATGDGHVAIVAHGGTLSAAIKVLLDIPAHRHPFRLKNASISRLLWEPGSTKLLTLNETAHLNGLGPAGTGDL